MVWICWIPRQGQAFGRHVGGRLGGRGHAVRCQVLGAQGEWQGSGQASLLRRPWHTRNQQLLLPFPAAALNTGCGVSTCRPQYRTAQCCWSSTWCAAIHPPLPVFPLPHVQVLEHPAAAGAHGVQQRAWVLRGWSLWHPGGEPVCCQGGQHGLQVPMQAGGM